MIITSMCEDAPPIFCSQVFSHHSASCELYHVYGFSHCFYFHCAMNESNSIACTGSSAAASAPSSCLRKFHNWIKFDLKKHIYIYIYTFILFISATHYVNWYSLTTHHLITTLSVCSTVSTNEDTHTSEHVCT